jgi:hypothetical protein
LWKTSVLINKPSKPCTSKSSVVKTKIILHN